MEQMSRARSTEPSAASREGELALAHRRHRIPRYRSLLWHWLTGLARPARRAAAAPLPRVEPGQVGITFIGHASVLVRYAGVHIACDPMLGQRLGMVRRAVRPGLSPAELGDVDLILIGTPGRDHLHAPTLELLPRSATIIVPPRCAHRVSRLGFARVVELGVGQSVTHRDVDISAAPVRHDGPEAGAGLSYVLRGDGPSVFFCGESGYFSGFADVGRRFRPDLALLPIGGYAPLSFRNRHMSPLDALHALEDLRARLMIPIRHGAFPLSYERLEHPLRWLRELAVERGLQPFVCALQAGQSRLFVPPPEIPGPEPVPADPAPVPEPVVLEDSGAIPEPDVELEPEDAGDGADESPAASP